MGQRITLTINGTSYAGSLADTEAAHALAARLPLAVSMDELNGNEKYAYVNGALPTSPERPGSIAAGDLMLYGSSCLVLFYESFRSSYSYTRLGRLDDPQGLAEAVGSGTVSVTWELA